MDILIEATVPEEEDTPRKKYLKSALSSLASENINKNKKIKILTQKVRRQKLRISSLKSMNLFYLTFTLFLKLICIHILIFN